MAIYSVLAGPFSALYIGNSTATATPLTQISTTGTKGYEVTYIFPEDEFCYATGQYEQSGTYKVALKLSFMSDDPQAFNLSMGNPIATADLNTSPSDTIYTVFLVDALHPTTSSILLPKMQTAVSQDVNRQKSAPYVLDIVMKFEGPDPTFSPAINSMSKWRYYGGISTLEALMGGMSPGL